MGAASHTGATGAGTGYGGTHAGNMGTTTGTTGGLSNSTNAGPHNVRFSKSHLGSIRWLGEKASKSQNPSA